MSIRVIFWDFDGVLIDSNAVRDQGFETVLAGYPRKEVEALLEFHRKNGGLSRYVKFRHFFEILRAEKLTDEKFANLLASFSMVMRNALINPDLLIQPTVSFVRDNADSYEMHIVSGSDQEELRYLCQRLGISKFFKSIHGSPTAKVRWVAKLIEQHNYAKSSCLLIGDSINDYEAARDNGIAFQAYNNPALERFSSYALV